MTPLRLTKELQSVDAPDVSEPVSKSDVPSSPSVREADLGILHLEECPGRLASLLLLRACWRTEAFLLEILFFASL